MTDQATPVAEPLVYAGELTIYSAAANYQRLRACLEQHQPIEIDCSGVTELDSAGLQLLLFAQAEAEAHALEFKLTGVSETLENVLSLLFLKRVFGLNPSPEART